MKTQIKNNMNAAYALAHCGENTNDFNMKNRVKYLIQSFLLIMALFLTAFSTTLKAQSLPAGCCPKFELAGSNIQPCDTRECDFSNVAMGTNGGGATAACKNQVANYAVFPNLPGFTYSWTVSGGTPSAVTGSQVNILWGTGQQGFFQVIIDNGAGCKDTIRRAICLLNGPVAGITFTPNPVCLNTPVNFSGTTSIGATTYQWDFGDGTYSSMQNPPPHSYNTPGIKNVILTVGTTGPSMNGSPDAKDCGCKDTAMVVINVLPQAGLTITPTNCNRMLCTNDTATYCVSGGSCASYNWNVNGGTIVGSSTGTCIKVKWDQPSVSPTSVTVAGVSCGPSVCGSTATLNVPVLYPNLQIQSSHPNVNVCPSSSVQYSLPALPGTFYQWSISGGGTIGTSDSNHNVITVNWGSASGGPFQVICHYNNPYSGCSGADTITAFVKPRFALFGIASVCLNDAMPKIYTTSPNVMVGSWLVAPAVGYTLGAPTGNNLPITWTQAGAYNISANVSLATASNYCTSNANLSVIVKDTAILGNITGSALVCAGTPTMYSVTSNQPGSFMWLVSNGTILQQYGANNDSVLVQFIGNGTLTVKQNFNGCVSAPKVFAVTAITSIGAITGNINVCIDETVTYTIAGPVPPGGYTWSLSNGLGTITSSSANSVTILWNGGVATGIATCVITASACTANATFNVNVKTPANGTITQTGNLCTPGVTLTAAIPGAVGPYTWTRNGLAHPGTTASIVTSLTGYYKVKATTGCFGFATANVPNTFTSTVSISTGDITIYCTGSTVNTTFVATLQSNNACTYSYQWYHNGNPVGTNSTTYTATAAGSYTVMITCGSCTATSNTMIVSIVLCDHCSIEKERPIGWDIGGPSAAEPTYVEMEEYSTLAYTVMINAPVVSTPFCNQVSFNANYNFTAPNSNAYGTANWSFGDGNNQTTTAAGNTGLTTTALHTYSSPGIYLVGVYMGANCPAPPYDRICPLFDTMSYIVPIAAKFGFNVQCNQVILSDLSSTLPSLGCNIASWSWTVVSGPAGATFNNASAQNPILTTTAPGVYSIALVVTSSCGGCQAKYVTNVTIVAPSATIVAPSPICAKTSAPFVPAQAQTPGFSYNWNFGDGYQSNLYNATHTYATAGTFIVTLSITDVMGCTAIDKDTITVVPPIVVNIPTLQYICPNSTHTFNANVVSGPGGTYTYQWYLNGNPIALATLSSYSATAQGNYSVQVSSGLGCVSKSNIGALWYSPKPIADIKGSANACITGGSASITLSSLYNSNYTYLWSASPAVSFVGGNTSNIVTATATLTGIYQFILLVTDNVTGCTARDTFCVWVNPSPTVAIAPLGYFCEGIAHTISVSPVTAGLIYSWSNGVLGTSIITGAAGSYSATAFNPNTGCTAKSNTVYINKRPYVALFPIGCDTLCDTAKIIPPLPLFNGQNYSAVYNIQWFVDGNPVGNFPILNANTLSPGNHSIYIVVNYLTDTCKATSGVYNVFIKKCGCNCDASHWGDITMQLGNGNQNNTKTANANNTINNKDLAATSGVNGGTNGGTLQATAAKDFNSRRSNRDKSASAGSNNSNTLNPNPNVLALDCNASYDVNCKQPLTINAGYVCADTSCPPLVTYKLQPPTGVALTGNMALNFTPNQTGSYSLTMYGWCGGNICDSCTVFFISNCDSTPPPNCCNGSIWAVKPTYAMGDNKKEIDCKNPVSIVITGKDCNKPLVVTAAIQCPPNCTSSTIITVYDNLNNIVQQGPAPQNLSALPNGIYNVIIIGYCNGSPCLKCELGIKKDCKEIPCNCEGSTWGNINLTEGGIVDQANAGAKSAVTNIPPVGSSQVLKCNKSYNLKCNKTYSINALYNCIDATCPPKVTYSLTYPNATISTGTAPFNFTTTQSGMYSLTLYGWCGNKICDSCKITFKVDCPPPPCCPYEIAVTPGQPTYSYQASSTTVTTNFGFSIPAAMNISEVRANVLSYTIGDNFNGDCMKCVNLPFTWGSFAGASNIGTAPPKITMYGGTTVPAFTGTGAAAYQNPREIVWNNNTNLNSPALSNIALNFIVPSAPNITCCDLKGKICVKFVFRDQNCKECEFVGCFDFVIKKP